MNFGGQKKRKETESTTFYNVMSWADQRIIQCFQVIHFVELISHFAYQKSAHIHKSHRDDKSLFLRRPKYVMSLTQCFCLSQYLLAGTSSPSIGNVLKYGSSSNFLYVGLAKLLLVTSISSIISSISDSLET